MGVVYVLVSPEHPGLCKVGKAASHERAKEHVQFHGYGIKWHIAHMEEAEDEGILETRVHRELRRRHLEVRLNKAPKAREVFLIGLNELLELVDQLNLEKYARRRQEEKTLHHEELRR